MIINVLLFLAGVAVGAALLVLFLNWLAKHAGDRAPFWLVVLMAAILFAIVVAYR